MIRLATVFSGIGAIEQALKQMNKNYQIVFACDNGERYLEVEEEEIRKKLKNKKDNEIKEIIREIYDGTGKINNVKKSYFANYEIDEDKWYEDIRFLDGKKYCNEVDLFVGGSPCQSFSTYGKRKGLEDTRGTLFYDYARLIKEINPKVFIYENVTGLLNHDKGKTWEIIKDVFVNLNYNISCQVLDAQDYGIPQMRKRLFVIGISNKLKCEEFKFPKKKKLVKFVEGYLDKVVDNKYYLPEKGFKYVTQNERNEGRARVNRKIIGCQTANQQFNWTGDFRVEPPKKTHLDDKRIFKSNYEDKICVARKLTPTECLRLMGFTNFNIVVPDQVMYRQVGNSIAVPVLIEIIKEIEKVVKLDE